MRGQAYYRTTYGEHLKHSDKCYQWHGIPCDPSVEMLEASTPIVIYVDADEWTHEILENDPAYHLMPSLTAGSPACNKCIKALAGHGAKTGDRMFDIAQKLAKVHKRMKPARF